MLLTLAALAVLTAPAQPAWTWTLYEGDGPVVLAEEIPDTPRLRNTLECERGSGVARITLYREDATDTGFVTLSAQEATTQTPVSAWVDDGQPHLTVPLRLDHPVFTAFRASGGLSVRGTTVGWTLEAPAASIRRFAELCAG